MAERTDTANGSGAPRAAVQSSPSSTGIASSSSSDAPWDFPDAAVRQVQHVFVFGGTFFTTVIALLSSAFGVVAAIAWSQAIMAWLPTITFLSFEDDLARKFSYAGVTTLVAVVTILALGLINSRLKPKKPTQQTSGAGSPRDQG